MESEEKRGEERRKKKAKKEGGKEVEGSLCIVVRTEKRRRGEGGVILLPVALLLLLLLPVGELLPSVLAVHYKFSHCRDVESYSLSSSLSPPKFNAPLPNTRIRPIISCASPAATPATLTSAFTRCPLSPAPPRPPMTSLWPLFQ